MLEVAVGIGFCEKARRGMPRIAVMANLRLERSATGMRQHCASDSNEALHLW